MIPRANQIYRHFKGNLYRVITVAEHTETEEKLVIYQALYGEFKIYARPLDMFVEEVDRRKYPNAMQKMRFEAIEQMVEMAADPIDVKFGITESIPDKQSEFGRPEEMLDEQPETENPEEMPNKWKMEETSNEDSETEEKIAIDPLLEAYLDTDSYREKLNILHGLHHRITENMLITMAVVIDFELPEGDIQAKYDALNDCLLTKEKYECNRII